MEERDPRTYAIIGAAFEVRRELGPGFLEAVYQEALALEFSARGIPFTREVDLPVYYKAQRLNTTYRADFLCFDGIIVELKAISELGRVERAIIIHYLKVSRHKIGLLLNFGALSLDFERFVL
jgi:GxxExxY protein